MRRVVVFRPFVIRSVGAPVVVGDFAGIQRRGRRVAVEKNTGRRRGRRVAIEGYRLAVGKIERTRTGGRKGKNGGFVSPLCSKTTTFFWGIFFFKKKIIITWAF
jgi:hypothetical protein